MLTGIFKRFYIFTILIFIHELGHFIAGVSFKWKVDKICIYPYGGCTKFDTLVNVSYLEEFIVLIMGPVFQIIFYLLIKNYISYNDYVILKNYNYAILFFNLLPIYPLDGGRLFNMLFSLVFPYKKSLYLSIYLSMIIFVFLFIYSKSISYYIVLFLLFFKLIKEYKNIKYYCNKFLLERYIYKLKFRKIKVIKKIDNFYKNKSHIIKDKYKYKEEDEYLSKHFNS